MLMVQLRKMRGPPTDTAPLAVFVAKEEQSLLAVYATKYFKIYSLKIVIAQALTNCNVNKNISVFFL
jgi:hypothetical protein